jgi:hypothetical protein
VKPTYRTLAFLLGLRQRVHDAAFREMPFGIVLVRALMDLPQIEVVGVQPSKRLLELALRHVGVSTVRADLRHQEHTLPAVLNGPAHPAFAFAVVVFPGVVKKVHAGVDRRVDDADRLLDRFDHAKVIAAETDDRDEFGVAAESAMWNLLLV